MRGSLHCEQQCQPSRPSTRPESSGLSGYSHQAPTHWLRPCLLVPTLPLASDPWSQGLGQALPQLLVSPLKRQGSALLRFY